jgi:endonuclease/exonuclease/phosphatase (EEP) superfamily protein YafD
MHGIVSAIVASVVLPRNSAREFILPMTGPPPSPEPRQPGKLRRFIVRRLRFIAVAMPLACAVLLLPFGNFLIELLRHFRLWNAVIGLGTGALLLLLRDWKFAAIALLAGVWQGWPVVEYSRIIPRRESTLEPGQSFTLLTCNLLYECREPDRMIVSVREANPDVLLLMEYTPEWKEKFRAELWKDYQYRVEEPLPGYSGICLASKLPLESPEVMEVAGGIPVIRARLRFAERSITLLCVHPPPPMRPELYEEWRASFGEWPGLLWGATVDPGYAVLAGDLNCTPFARAFTELCERSDLRDSARDFGLASTWSIAGTPLGLPLDHVLVSRKLMVAEHIVREAPGSDHRWVMVRLVPTW